MEPTLVDGQGLIAMATENAEPGQLRCLEHPERPGFWLVKRVDTVHGPTMYVMSDNTAVPAVDSREFGPVPIAGSYRVIVKIPVRFM